MATFFIAVFHLTAARTPADRLLMVAAAAPDLSRPNTTRLLAQGGTADPVGMALFLPSLTHQYQ